MCHCVILNVFDIRRTAEEDEGEFMREKRDLRLKPREEVARELTPEILIGILRQTTNEKDAVETYKRLTGENPPEKGE